MTQDAVKAGILALFALLLLFVNVKTSRSSTLKTVTFIALWVVLAGVGWFVWEVISA